MNEISFPLGTRKPRTPYSTDDVIGEVLPTAAGNTSIRVGKLAGDRWQQTAFITITPEERDLLIRELQAHAAEDDR